MTELSGIHIQWPWSQLLLSGRKTVETRTFPLPKKYIGVKLAIIETPGKRGLREAGIKKARIVGVITFKESFAYTSRSNWENDYARHCVSKDDSEYGWSAEKQKYGWIVESAYKLQRHSPAPKKRGIIFASSCSIQV